MKKLILFILALSLILSLTGCAGQGQSENLMENVTRSTGPVMVTSGEEEPKVLDFYVRLFRQTHGQDENTLISPLSILQALSMTANGAKGETLEQMEEVFGVSLDLLNRANINHDDGTGKLSIANSVWFRDSGDFTVNQDFLQTNADYYGADIFKAPFDDATCKEINAWVEEHTDGMIPSVLDEIPETAVMYLVNALAFDARWEEIYREDQVRNGTFTTQRGYTRDVEMMYSEEGLYYEDAYASGFFKYYEGGRYAFVGLLPHMGITLEEYLEVLDGAYLHNLLSNPWEARVMVSMPKFRVEYDVAMSEILQEMGMTNAFRGDLADFSGIGHSDLGNLYISRVLHKTFIQVDEQGTKAGAATAVEINAESAMEPDHYAVSLDRPFVYMIVDMEYACPLFLGTMMDPTGEEAEPIAQEPLASAPMLTIRWEGGQMAVQSGNYSWRYTLPDTWSDSWEVPEGEGQTQAVIACGAHPLDNIDNRDFTAVTGEWLTLSFPVPPDRITVFRWPGEDLGNPDAAEQAVEPEGFFLPVEEGDWVYQVIAQWDGDGWGGSAEYHLYLSGQE